MLTTAHKAAIPPKAAPTVLIPLRVRRLKYSGPGCGVVVGNEYGSGRAATVATKRTKTRTRNVVCMTVASIAEVVERAA